jgi:hypothetical protein
MKRRTLNSGYQTVVRVPLGVHDNNWKWWRTQKKGVKIKTQKQSYEVLVYKERLM